MDGFTLEGEVELPFYFYLRYELMYGTSCACFTGNHN